MYAALEIKELANGTMTVDRYIKETREEAEKAYHSMLAVAAVSTHPVHSAMIINPEGVTLKRDVYKHEQPEPAEEPAEQAEE